MVGRRSLRCGLWQLRRYFMIRNSQQFSCGVLALLFLASCGGAEWPECETCGATTTSETSDEINIEKLVGTPFEGLTTGDDFPYYFFICDQYRTESIDSFPIPIFLAFFTEEQEAAISEGIEIANQSIGFTAYELSNVWIEDIRVIYRVANLDDASGQTRYFSQYFNSRIRSEAVPMDWTIVLTSTGINKWVVAHELGHATGISGHYLIDYENDTISDLEENSLMEPILPTNPVLNDYEFMMSTQGEIMMNHLGESGTLLGSDCDGLKDYYDSQTDEE